MSSNEIEESILTKKRFSKLIENYIAQHPDSTYMEAVVNICEDRSLDPLDVGKLISPAIKDKIEAEAIKHNLVKGGGNSLPI